MPQNRLLSQLSFLVEIDGLKSVLRRSRIADRSRRENSAEHSWHLAMFALVLVEAPDLDVAKIIAMLLVHDIVEIDAGDAPIHDHHDPVALAAKEGTAADRLFELLPKDQSKRFLRLWHEFESGETPEARFAKAVDRFQPLLLNTLSGGGTWTEGQVTEAQVYERYGPTIERGSPVLWAHARELVHSYFSSLSA